MAKQPTKVAKKSTKKKTTRKSTAKPATAKLTAEQEAKLEAEFKKSTARIDRTDVKYALDKTLSKAEELLKSSSEWIVGLGRQAKMLFTMLKSWWSEEYDLPWGTVAAITTALLYFVNPIDLVPDFIPLIGFLDDLAIIAICVKAIQADLRKYAEAKNIDLKALGL
ncbi:MAG: YkvA family protein [Planctomycetota bacterium]